MTYERPHDAEVGLEPQIANNGFDSWLDRRLVFALVRRVTPDPPARKEIVQLLSSCLIWT